MVDGLSDRLAVAKVDTIAYTLGDRKCKALGDTLAVRLREV